MAPKLLATDLDGTLLASDGTVHAEDAAAIRELNRRGVRVTFSTGRMHSGCGHFARELELTTPLVCLDGAQIVDPQTGASVHIAGLPAECVPELRHALRHLGAATFLFSADRIYHDAAGDAAAPYVSIWTREMERVDNVMHHPSWDDGAMGLVTVGEQRVIEELQAAIHSELPALDTASFISNRPGHEGVWAMLVRRQGISKASGLEHLCSALGINMSEVVGVGDWLNDLTMLRAVGHSYAMGQSPPEVVEAAGQVLVADHTSGGGIAEAARRAGLL